MKFRFACSIPHPSQEGAASRRSKSRSGLWVLLFLCVFSISLFAIGCSSSKEKEGEGGRSDLSRSGSSSASASAVSETGSPESLTREHGMNAHGMDAHSTQAYGTSGASKESSEAVPASAADGLGAGSSSQEGTGGSESGEVSTHSEVSRPSPMENGPHIEEAVKAPEGNGLLGVKGAVSVRSILEQMMSVYRNAQTYRDQGEIRVSWTQNGNPHERRVVYRTNFQRPNHLFLEVNQTGILADGKTFWAYTSEMPGLLLERECPKELGILDILCERELYWAVTDVESNRFSYLPPPLVLLLSEDPLLTFLHEAEQSRISLLTEDQWEGKRCFRISLLRGECEQTIFWIDAESFLLRRVELPRQVLQSENEAGNEEMVVTLDFNGAEVDWTGVLEMSVPANSVVVSSFTQPQMELLGTVFPDFQFTLLKKGEAAPTGTGDGSENGSENAALETPALTSPETARPETARPETAPYSELQEQTESRVLPESLTNVQSAPLTKKSFAGKTVFLFFWSVYETNIFHFQDMEQLFQEVRVMPNVSLLGVNVDSPEMSAEKILAASETFGLTCPIARDASGKIAQMLRNGETFSCFLLDAQGVVQYCDTLSLFHPNRRFSEFVHRAASGESLFQERILELKRAEADYQETIRLWVENGIFLKETETEKIEITEPRIEPASEPVACRKKELWVSETLYSPTSILPEPEKKRILVLENGNSVAVLDPLGKVAERHLLPIPEDEFLETLRSVETSAGTVYAAIGKRIFLFDASWNPKTVYPPMQNDDVPHADGESVSKARKTHGAVSDVLLGDWDRDGEPELYAAFWDEEAFLKLSLTGEVMAVGEGVSNVFQIAGMKNLEKPELKVIDQSGAISTFSPKDLELKGVQAIPQRTLCSLKVHDFGVDGNEEMAGIALGVRVKFKAVGVTLDGKELWNLDLPNYAYQRKIEKILPLYMDSESEVRTGWLVIGPDSSLHLMEPTGMLIDEFHFGKLITGAASCVFDGRPCLFLAAPDSVTALEIGR